MTNVDKTFTVAGTATHKGVTKVRFANDLVARIKILNKAGCTDINLVELPSPMSKLEALRYLHSIGITEGDAGFAVANKLTEKSRKAMSSEVKVQATRTTRAAKPKVTAQDLVDAVKAPA